VGVTPRLFRAPGGEWTPALETEARTLGMSPLKWDVDPRDWARPGAKRILGVALTELHPGAVVLMHDGGGDRRQTLQALKALLLRLRAWKYTVAVPS
jgi:peptidoglycan/xylan/chitin deacetylase (PgdA/CDA1 family)